MSNVIVFPDTLDRAAVVLAALSGLQAVEE